MKLAHDSIATLLRGWETTDSVTKVALHASCVVAYARPFTSARTKSGNISYPIKGLKKVDGFDSELHVHLLDLRHRIIAHGDYDLFPSSMYLQTIGDERLPVRLGLNVKAMAGIHARELAERYQKHLSICIAAIESALNQDCTELAEQARLYPW